MFTLPAWQKMHAEEGDLRDLGTEGRCKNKQTTKTTTTKQYLKNMRTWENNMGNKEAAITPKAKAKRPLHRLPAWSACGVYRARKVLHESWKMSFMP